jgi:hypothetical protein
VFRYVRYMLTALWAAPWVFVRLGLAEAEKKPRVLA